ncbi:MAG TPA: CapA family protein [Candidatus Cloacimonadota bacterium]|nr:CapA family protein [Candidatus Cloacimonadota bacterium]
MKRKSLSGSFKWQAVCLILIIFFGTGLAAQSGDYRYTVIQDFESGQIELTSWADEDVSPNSWQLTSSVTHQGSAWALQLSGNTWKQQTISPVVVDSGAVFEMAARTSSGANVQGIGFCDGTHALFYSISGNRVLDLEEWIPVYQGAFSNGVWNSYQFPIADDWWSFFDYLPTITSLIYVNDLDGVNNRSVYFDNIINISTDIPAAPNVSISQQITLNSFVASGTRDVGVQFQAIVSDPDSDTFTYLWEFGDGQSSNLAAPYHLYTVADDHPYRVHLKVTDATGRWGLASSLVNVDPGNGSLPLKLNFVGDIMLARRYEQGGGIIPTQGVNAIFAPTLDLLGNAADITSANLEVVLSNVGSPHPTKSVVYRGSPNNISGLVYAGIDKVTTANNHTLDYGLEAMQQMQGLLDQNRIIHNGAGANSYQAYTPAFTNRSGLNIAWLASCDRTGQYNNAQPFLQAGYNKPGFAYMTPYYMIQQLAAVEGIADLKIMELHGGSEYSLAPGAGYDKNNPFLGDDQDEDYSHRTDVPHMWDLEIRRHAIDSGADLVIVHHPHIVQAMEVYNGKLIAHSLGNFVFDLDYPETMPSLILYADADHNGFSNFLVRPVYIDAYVPKPANGRLGGYILEYLAHQSALLNTKLLIDYADMSAQVVMDDSEAQASYHSYKYNHEIAPQGAWNRSLPFKLPRYGSITSVDQVSPVSDAQARFGTETIWYGNFEDEGSSLWDVSSFSTTDVLDGARSAMIAPNYNQTSTATIKSRCKWYDNTKSFILHGWIKTRNATNANILIRYYNTRTGGQIGNESITTNINGSTDWTWYYKELTIPANAWYYDIRLTCTSNTSGTVQALFDNVGLIEWTPWQNASELLQIMTPNYYHWCQLQTQENPKSLNFAFTELLFSPAGSRKETSVPALLKLKSWPNPFSRELNIAFDLDAKGPVIVDVYNLRGQKLRSLISGELPAGKHQAVWDGRDSHGRQVASGMYFIRLKQDKASAVSKVILLR